MLDIEELWPIFLENARLYQRKSEIFVSPKRRSPYKIVSTDSGIVRIKRLSVTNSTETVSKEKFATCIRTINKLYPNIPKNSLYEHVVAETTIVELLPLLNWDEQRDNIIVEAQSLTALVPSPEQRQEKAYTQAVIRKGQQKLREKLLYQYAGKCAISRCAIEVVLNACHITPYVETEACLSEDAILLRSDLHDLFDAHLLAIHPESLQVHLHPGIHDSEYHSLHGKRISERIDGERISLPGLRQRWDNFIRHQGSQRPPTS